MYRQRAEIIRTTIVGFQHNFYGFFLRADNATASPEIFVDVEIFFHLESRAGRLTIQNAVEGIDQEYIFRTVTAIFFVLLAVAIGVIRTPCQYIPPALDYFKVVRLYIEIPRLRLSKTLMRDIEHLIVAYGIGDDVKPFMTGRNILEDDASFQFPICLNLVHGCIGVNEPNAKIVFLQIFGMVDVILITTLDVTSNLHLKDVENGFAMVMESAEGEIIIVSIAQSASMPKVIYLFIGQSAISSELFYQPYVTAKYICCHRLFI